MSSKKTPNLGLHEWVPDDYVLMEEFNDNFKTLDDHAEQIEQTVTQNHNEVMSHLAQTATKQELMQQELMHKPNRDEVFLKQFGININDLDEETRQAILENNNIDINYVLGKDNVKNENIAPNSVSPRKTTFFDRTKNLYHGDLVPGFVYGTDNEGIADGTFGEPSSSGEKSCIIKVVPGETYTITSYGGNRRRYAVYEEYPEYGAEPVELIESLRSGGNSSGSSKTFTNPSNAHYLVVYLSSTGEDVKCQVEIGDKSTDYVEPHIIPSNKIGLLQEDNLPRFSGDKIIENTINERQVSFLNKSSKNLYHGNLVPGFIYDKDNGPLSGKFGDPNGGPFKVCVIEIVPNETYTITPYGEGDRRLYAVFESYPEFGDDCVELVQGTNRNENPVTFTNPSNGHYLVVYLSSTGEDVKCQVEIGDKSTEYEPPYTLKPTIGVGDNRTKDNVLRIREKYHIYETFPLDYKPLPQLPANEDGEFNANTSTHTDIYNLYDDLMSEHPNYITREILGLDDYGNELRAYKLEPPRIASGHEDFPPNRLKMIWVSGVHGNERTYPYALFKIIEEICERKDNHNFLNFLRTSVDIIVIPVATPSAYDDDTRNKRNGVNINRNFNNEFDSVGSGSHPFSEPEAQAIKTVVEENLDAEILLDFHNYFSPRDHIFWAAFETNFKNEAKEKFYYDYLSMITKRLSNDYEWFTFNDVPVRMSYETRSSVESFGEENNMFSHTVEIRDHIPQKPNNKKLDEANIEFAMEYAVNMMAGIINTF